MNVRNAIDAFAGKRTDVEALVKRLFPTRYILKSVHTEESFIYSFNYVANFVCGFCLTSVNVTNCSAILHFHNVIWHVTTHSSLVVPRIRQSCFKS